MAENREIMMSKQGLEDLGRVAYETMALIAIASDLQRGAEFNPKLLMKWPETDEETRVVYRTMAHQIMSAACKMANADLKIEGPLDEPPWRQFFKLVKTQANSSEPNVIFAALGSDALPEA
jgi:hypothetical protein